jgi:hypothetical protein
MDITKMSEEEIIKDRLDSLADIEICAHALRNDVTEYSGGSVMDRMETNWGIVKKVDAELKRRALKHSCGDIL